MLFRISACQVLSVGLSRKRHGRHKTKTDAEKTGGASGLRFKPSLPKHTKPLSMKGFKTHITSAANGLLLLRFRSMTANPYPVSTPAFLPGSVPARGQYARQAESNPIALEVPRQAPAAFCNTRHQQPAEWTARCGFRL